MTYNTILFTQEDRVATITLNRPERLNAVNAEMTSEMLAAIEDIKRNEETRVVILTATGRGFCSGADVRRSDGDDVEWGPLSHSDAMRDGSQRLTLALWHLDKPVIAAINGVAAAYGLTIALLCDFRIASDAARFTDSALKLGLLADEGGTYLLPRVIGLEQAARLMYTAEIIDAGEAMSIGLVGQVVPHDRLLSEASALAKRLASGPPVAMRITKRAIRRHAEMPLEKALEDVGWLACIVNPTEDAREGVQAFRERRTPIFRGR